MTKRESVWFRIAWISLAIIGGAIFAFGLIVAVWPGSSEALFLRAIGVDSMGMQYLDQTQIQGIDCAHILSRHKQPLGRLDPRIAGDQVSPLRFEMPATQGARFCD